MEGLGAHFVLRLELGTQQRANQLPRTGDRIRGGTRAAGDRESRGPRRRSRSEQGRLALCKYILRPPLANERLTIIDDEHVRLAFKRPWSDGTTSVELTPLALMARLAAIVPPPRR